MGGQKHAYLIIKLLDLSQVVSIPLGVHRQSLQSYDNSVSLVWLNVHGSRLWVPPTLPLGAEILFLPHQPGCDLQG